MPDEEVLVLHRIDRRLFHLHLVNQFPVVIYLHEQVLLCVQILGNLGIWIVWVWIIWVWIIWIASVRLLLALYTHTIEVVAENAVLSTILTLSQIYEVSEFAAIPVRPFVSCLEDIISRQADRPGAVSFLYGNVIFFFAYQAQLESVVASGSGLERNDELSTEYGTFHETNILKSLTRVS